MEPANVLNIKTLDENWRDADSLILHACFQILVDFVETEKAFESHVDWEHDEKHISAKKEILELYHWWKPYKEPSPIENATYPLENEMLKRLIDVRWALWT